VAHVPNLAVLAPLLSLAACAAPPDERHEVAGADPDRGRVAMERVGCGACHTIPGIWPEGEVGPRLARLADRSLIAGRLPNRPDLLAAFVRDAPALVPGSAMPAMPLSAAEARDVAAYLYALDDR
jgi:mono/diheme cytochrome c family protein